jgi:hypothetical protein
MSTCYNNIDFITRQICSLDVTRCFLLRWTHFGHKTYLFNITNDAFKIAAKLTQRIYGNSNIAAGFDIARNLLILKNMASHKIIITIKPPDIDRQPKKTTDQKILSANCRKNIKIAPLVFPFLIPFSHTRNNEIPIIANKVIQTGPKTESGGLNCGLFIKGYHTFSDRNVKKEPTTPAN